MVGIYDTSVMIQVVEDITMPQSFLLDSFFNFETRWPTSDVTMDIDDGKRRITPLVTPTVQGRLVKGRGFRSQTIKPAYAKDKRAIDPEQPIQRRIGERIGGGDMDPEEREQAILDTELDDQVGMLTRRQELMAADALLDGQLTLEIIGLGTVIVDFGRDPDLTVVLAGPARWGEAGVSPARDLDNWVRTVLRKSGAVVTDIIFTSGAFDDFTDDPKVEKALDTRRGGDSRIEIASQVETGAVFKGIWGNYRVWLYNDWYVDEADVEHPILPDNTVILGGPQIRGVRHYGAIRDPRAGYRALPFFPKSWIEEDPAERMLMLQSAPIVARGRVNASFAATVK